MFGLFKRRRFISDGQRHHLKVGDLVFPIFFISFPRDEFTLAFWKYKSCTLRELEEFCERQTYIFRMTCKFVAWNECYYKVAISHVGEESSGRSYFRISWDDYCDFMNSAVDRYDDHFNRFEKAARRPEVKLCWKKLGF